MCVRECVQVEGKTRLARVGSRIEHRSSDLVTSSFTVSVLSQLDSVIAMLGNETQGQAKQAKLYH